MSQHRGVQRGGLEKQNLRQNEACSGILENREGGARKVAPGWGLRGKWKRQMEGAGHQGSTE